MMPRMDEKTLSKMVIESDGRDNAIFITLLAHINASLCDIADAIENLTDTIADMKDNPHLYGKEQSDAV